MLISNSEIIYEEIGHLSFINNIQISMKPLSSDLSKIKFGNHEVQSLGQIHVEFVYCLQIIC